MFDGHGGKFFSRLIIGGFRLGSGAVREEVLCQRTSGVRIIPATRVQRSALRDMLQDRRSHVGKRRQRFPRKPWERLVS